MDPSLVFLAPVGAVCALIFAAFTATKVLKAEEGTDKMKEISLDVRKGANAYLKRQYIAVSIVFAILFVVLLIMSFALPGFHQTIPFGFVTGGIFSALAGFFGMKIATNANARTANACRTSLNGGLRVAFNSGAVMGMVVVGLGLLYLSIWYFILQGLFNDLAVTTSAMLSFGMGASIMALFARVGGGIFTKAADVGADLVGKVEAGIPEDDPRNPAVIADNVGDNVGDVAGMGADLYESYVVAIAASSALALAAMPAALQGNAVVLPLILAALGIFASIIGTFFVRTKEGATENQVLWALRYGVYGSSILIAIASFFLVQNLLGSEFIGIYFAILIGLVAGNAIGFTTEYFTSGAYSPTQKLSESSQTGPATIIIGGLSLGMVSTAFPVLIVGVAVMFSFIVAGTSGGGAMDLTFTDPGFISRGMYGVGIAAVGMLSTLGVTLATDAYGPIADNAGGIAEMSGLPDDVRERTDLLDSLGNTTAATGKGFAIGSAALTTLAMIAAFSDEILKIAPDFNFNLGVDNPPVLIGLFIGAMVVFVFSAFTMQAVNRAAQGIVEEVRRQFREIKGLLEGKEGVKADYERCVDICTRSAQREMVVPSLLGVFTPILVGIFLGINGMVGMMVGALVCGFIMALMMSNAGGAWDNAKKYIESGKLGGKGSDNHKAAVVGDTIGDPFKDTSGPSLNNFIKLLSVVSIVFAPLVLAITIMQ